MATTTVAHASLIRYDNDGNQLVINLKNTGDDVSITGSANSNLPAGATTVQGLANSLGTLAFKNSLSKADVGLGNVDNTADVNKSVNYASTAGSATKVTRIKHLSTTEELDGFIEANAFQYATVASIAPIKNDGIILSMTWKDSTKYGHQIYIDDTSSLMMQRGRQNDSGTWGDWVKMIDSSNIGSQSVNYANTAGSANAVAWDNVTGKPSVYTPASHTHTKSEVGLGNVDNTADSAKSVKYATSAGSANAVSWGNVSGKPSTYTPASHTHTKSQITDFPSSLPASDVYSWAKAASKPSYSKSEVGLGNVDNTADANKSVNYATTAGATTKVTRAKHLSTAEELDGFAEANVFQYATVDSIAPINNDGIILSMTWKDNPNFAHQIYINDDDFLMMQRGRHDGTWSNWVKMIDSSNIGSQSVNYANTAGAATKATHVVDYNNNGCTIDIGYNGSGITGDAIKYIAGYTTGANGSTARIKDVSKSALISWMGVLPGDSIFYVSKEAPSVPCIWAKID